MRQWLLGVILLMGWQAQANAQLAVEDVWIRESIPGAASTALFATVNNPGSSERVLVAVQVAGVDKVELHTTLQEDGMMRMRRISELKVGAGETVKLMPGAAHVMLFRLQQPLKKGQEVAVVFEFANGEKVKAVASVVATNQPSHEHHHHH